MCTSCLAHRRNRKKGRFGASTCHQRRSCPQTSSWRRVKPGSSLQRRAICPGSWCLCQYHHRFEWRNHRPGPREHDYLAYPENTCCERSVYLGNDLGSTYHDGVLAVWNCTQSRHTSQSKSRNATDREGTDTRKM